MKIFQEEQRHKLLSLFSDFITTVENKKTSSWKLTEKLGEGEVIVKCFNGTRNYIHNIPVSIGVLSIFNSLYPEYQLKEVERYSIEDEDTHTHICWKLKYISNESA